MEMNLYILSSFSQGGARANIMQNGSYMQTVLLFRAVCKEFKRVLNESNAMNDVESIWVFSFVRCGVKCFVLQGKLYNTTYLQCYLQASEFTAERG